MPGVLTSNKTLGDVSGHPSCRTSALVEILPPQGLRTHFSFCLCLFDPSPGVKRVQILPVCEARVGFEVTSLTSFIRGQNPSHYYSCTSFMGKDMQSSPPHHPLSPYLALWFFTALRTTWHNILDLSVLVS